MSGKELLAIEMMKGDRASALQCWTSGYPSRESGKWIVDEIDVKVTSTRRWTSSVVGIVQCACSDETKFRLAQDLDHDSDQNCDDTARHDARDLIG